MSLAPHVETEISNFLDLYGQRPLKENPGGMGLNHAYMLYRTLKSLQPKLVIESGVWRGQSTWLIEQACPKAEIISVDPRPDLRRYTSRKARYTRVDFSQIDWSNSDVSDAVCFFDDHQNALSRLKEMKWWNFRTAIFDDNYPPGEGDAYSIRQILAHSGHDRRQLSRSRSFPGLREILAPVENKILKKYGPNQDLLVPPNTADAAGFLQNVERWHEIPALLLPEQSAWGTGWDGKYAPTVPPICGSQSDHPGLDAFLSQLSNEERFEELNQHYMCQVSLTPS